MKSNGLMHIDWNINGKAAVCPSHTPILAVKPFFPWAGNKNKHFSLYQPLLPDMSKVNRYHEPFIGSASFFFNLRRQGFKGTAYLNDMNERMMNCYQGVKENPSEVIKHFQELERRHSKDIFFNLCHAFNRSWSIEHTAGWFIYITRGTYRRVYKENRQGHCASGCRDILNNFDTRLIYMASMVLQKTELAYGDFGTVLAKARANDFVFMDPPYPDCFNKYVATGFSPFDHHRLAYVCRTLNRKGALFMQTNADCPLVRNLYKDFHIKSVITPRNLTHNSAKEVVIINY